MEFLTFCLFIIFKDFVFKAVLDSNKIEQKVRTVSIHPFSRHAKPPTVHIPHLRGAFATVDELALTQHHPQSAVYNVAHAWCCTLLFHGFGQMHHDIYAKRPF